MKKSRAIMIIIAAGLSVLLAACSGAGDKGAQTASEAQAAQEASAAAEVQTEPVAEETTTAPGENAEYVGHSYQGKDPWEGEISVAITSIVDGKMDWIFTNRFEEHVLNQELQGTEITNGVAEFSLDAKDENDESVSCDYTGTLELKDGKIVMTLKTGAMNVKGSEGGYSARMAEALADSGLSNAVELNKLPDLQ